MSFRILRHLAVAMSISALLPSLASAEQQIADAFYREGLLPKPVDASAVTLYEPREQ